jgi:hypothetical protein
MSSVKWKLWASEGWGTALNLDSATGTQEVSPQGHFYMAQWPEKKQSPHVSPNSVCTAPLSSLKGIVTLRGLSLGVLSWSPIKLASHLSTLLADKLTTDAWEYTMYTDRKSNVNIVSLLIQGWHLNQRPVDRKQAWWLATMDDPLLNYSQAFYRLAWKSLAVPWKERGGWSKKSPVSPEPRRQTRNDLWQFLPRVLHSREDDRMCCEVQWTFSLAPLLEQTSSHSWLLLNLTGASWGRLEF